MNTIGNLVRAARAVQMTRYGPHDHERDDSYADLSTALTAYEAASTWTPDCDEPLALAEGWCVYAVDRPYCSFEIQKEDEMAKFTSDDSALGHVFERALQGSELHQRAINFVLSSQRD